MTYLRGPIGGYLSSGTVRKAKKRVRRHEKGEAVVSVCVVSVGPKKKRR